MKFRKFFSSLATRFALVALLSASVGFGALAALVAYRHETGMQIQAEELGRLSDSKFAALLDTYVLLAKARLDKVVMDVGHNLAEISQRVDVQRTILSENVVAISEVLGKAASNNKLDGIIVVDEKLKILGAQSGSVDLVGVNKSLGQSQIISDLHAILVDNTRETPKNWVKVVHFDQEAASALGSAAIAPLAIVAAHPVFDEFGDLAGALIGYRIITPTEATFREFATLTGGTIAIFSQDALVTQAGQRPDADLHFTRLSNDFLQSEAFGLVARCLDYGDVARFCAARSASELNVLRSEITRSGYVQGRILTYWLIGLSVFFLACFGLVSFIMARALTRPLERITQSVKAVAAGDWSGPVDSRDRADEVGDIARAVVALQGSMHERDILRADVVSQNAELLAKEHLLSTQNIRFNAALANMSQGLCLLDSELRIIVFNERYEQIMGLPPGSAEVGKRLGDIAGQISDAALQKDYCALIEAHERLLAVNNRDALNIELSDGRTILVLQRPTADGGLVATLADITERKRNEQRIDYLAHHDSLTSLPNRVTWHRELAKSFEALQLHQQLAVFSLDLDRFKAVNDTLGHSMGDAVLRVVATRLSNVVRGSDVISRIGGDEFAILQRNLASRDEVIKLAERIIAAINVPIIIEDHKLVIGVSIGIALAPDDGIDYHQLQKMADVALYRVKKAGSSDYCFFDSEMDARESAQRALESELRQALEKNQFHLLYQPIVDSDTCKPIAFEALLRWDHPVRGVVSPAEFIPMAENLGLIVPIGNWVLRSACATAATWPEDIAVAINISPLQISEGGLGLSVLAALNSSGLSARRLELEITESVLLENSNTTIETLHELRALGIRFSLDDYGTGYSSLRSLRSFPFDKIKIDQSFVRDLSGAHQNSLIVNSVCSLAKGLGMQTIAEGVETEEQMHLLHAAGCDALQGYLFGRPLSAANAAAMLNQRQPKTQRAIA